MASIRNQLICRYPSCGFQSGTLAEYDEHQRSHGTSQFVNYRSLQDFLKPRPRFMHQDLITNRMVQARHPECMQVNDAVGLPMQPNGVLDTTSTRVFKCDWCSKVFTRAFTLRSHVRAHRGERPYKCEQCPKAFTRDNDRKTHQATHGVQEQSVCRGEFQGKPWGCGRSFSRARNLERHYQHKIGIRCTRSEFTVKPRTCQTPNRDDTRLEVEKDEDGGGNDENGGIVIAEGEREQARASLDQSYQSVLDQYRYLEQHNSDVIESSGVKAYLQTSDHDNGQHTSHPAVKTLSAAIRSRYPPEQRPVKGYWDRHGHARCYWCAERQDSISAFINHRC